MTEQLFLPTTPGLEPALLREVQRLGFAQAREVKGGVELSGDAGAHEVLNLWSAIASRVLLRVATVKQPGDLSGVSLSAYGKAFTVEGDGRFAEAARRKWPVGVDGVLLFREEKGGCTVSLDTSGELLHVRGYRQEIGRAPLRETLAAGVLELAGYEPLKPLWDVMCGSGTFVIEAALRAVGRAPGADRKFAFETWPSHDAKRFAARPRTREGVAKPVVMGTDLNSGALGTARRNGRRAGVLEHLTLERLDALKAAPKAGLTPGLLLANLPYGKRVGDPREVPTLLKALASLPFPGWRKAWLLPAGVHVYELPEPYERISVRNGGIKCDLWLTR